MLRIKGTRIIASVTALVMWFFSSSHIYAQTPAVSSATNSPEIAGHSATLPLMKGQGVVTERPHTPGLTGIAAYADGRPELTPEQIKIGFALTNKDREGALALIKQARGSVDFPVWKDSPHSPLIMAASQADTEMVTSILEKGVAVDSALSTDWLSGQTALICILSTTFQTYPSALTPDQSLEMIRFLLKAGASPKAKRNDGKTPMSIALTLRPPDPAGEKIKKEIVQALLSSGGDKDLLPLGAASSEGEIEIAKFFAEHGINAKAWSSTGLAAAVQYRRPDLVKLLLAKGADPNARALSAPRPVIADADMDTAKLLLAAGAKPNVCSDENVLGKCTEYGRPLIFGAAADPEFFRMMIAKGANPNAEDGQGQTALGYTLSYRTSQEQGINLICVGGTENCFKPEDKFDRTAATRMLLDAGADPNKRSAGKSPLTMADDNEHEIITMLLDKGARSESISINAEQVGPIALALAANRIFLANELLRRVKGKLHADEKWALYAAATEGKLELAQALIQHGVRPDERGLFGETALHHAAHKGNAAMVKWLLASGADPNAQVDAMPEPTMPSLNPINMLQELAQERKAEVYSAMNIPPAGYSAGKATPLMLAVTSGDVEAVKALLDGGARTSIKSQYGRTALDVAHSMGNREMERLLAGR